MATRNTPLSLWWTRRSPQCRRLGPDGVEAMLAVQMVAIHNAAMGFLRKATLPEQSFEGMEANVNRATKLLRTYVAQVEALSRFRTKGQQTIKVEHVTVESGGQAVVGNVQVGGGG